LASSFWRPFSAPVCNHRNPKLKTLFRVP
jgi:hypothetical protein